MSTTGLPQDIKPKVRTIAIILTDGTTSYVGASVYGPLAVHTNGDVTMITHVPTGMAIHWFWSRSHARQVVRRLLALPIDWTAITATSGIVDLDAATKALIKEALK